MKFSTELDNIEDKEVGVTISQMIMKYGYLIQYPSIFLSMTGLRVVEFDELVRDLQAAYDKAEAERLSRADRQRAIGGGITRNSTDATNSC